MAVCYIGDWKQSHVSGPYIRSENDYSENRSNRT